MITPVYSPDEGDVSQGTVSLLDISVSNDEDTHKCKAREVAHKNDTNFAAWKDKLISDGTTGLQERDNVVNDYADGKRKPKNPNFLGPLSLIWKNVGSLSHYPPQQILWGYVVFTPWIQQLYLRFQLRSRRPRWTIYGSLLILAKTQPHPYIIVVCTGGAITALGLLQELHSRSALAHIPIYRPDETKDGHMPRVSCCPFCAYMVQNDPAYLNHIVGTHYNANFTCGTCLSAVTSSCQQMKRHLNECKGLDPPMLSSSQGSAAPPTASQESVRGGRSPKKSS